MPRDLLEGAKQYASQNDTTLTRLVSEFLRRLGAQEDWLAQAPTVRRLSGALDGMAAAHSLTALSYLVAKYHSAGQARVTLGELLGFLPVAAVDQEVIERALRLPYDDLDDAVQMIAAVRAGARYLVTRNVHDYAAGPLPALQPAELLALL